MALYKKTHGRRLEPTGRFVVYCNDLLVKKSFPSPEAAKEWAEYNYEHKNCWRVGPEMKRALIRTAERGDKQGITND